MSDIPNDVFGLNATIDGNIEAFNAHMAASGSDLRTTPTASELVGALDTLKKIIQFRDEYSDALAARENGVSAGIRFHEQVFDLLWGKTADDFEVRTEAGRSALKQEGET